MGGSRSGLLYANSIYVLALDDFLSSDFDETSIPRYYGFLNPRGEWYIQRDDDGEYRYVYGTSNYPTAWTNRATQSYNYLNAVF